MLEKTGQTVGNRRLSSRALSFSRIVSQRDLGYSHEPGHRSNLPIGSDPQIVASILI
jgi:hypothetical protein